MHDIHVAVAKHYVENLRDEVKKGIREKAEQGIYPGRSPFGYRNNRVTRSVDVDETRSLILYHIFELYASGRHSLTTLRKAIFDEHGVRINRGYLETILKNPFYIGRFVWRGVTYDGKHTPLVSLDLFQRVQDAFAGRNKPRYRKHQFAFSGLLRCAHDDCTVTTELQKGRYIYYRCSQGRGKCQLPYMREPDIANRLGEVLKSISIPGSVVTQIVASLRTELDRSERERRVNLAALQQRLSAIRTRMNQIYEDKLDSKISEEFWDRKQAEYRDQERVLQVQIDRAGEQATAENVTNVQRIFGLAQSAYSLYFTRNGMEQGQLLKSVLLNGSTDGVSLWLVYGKPFDLIFQRAKRQGWSALEDDFRTFPLVERPKSRLWTA